MPIVAKDVPRKGDSQVRRLPSHSSASQQLSIIVASGSRQSAHSALADVQSAGSMSREAVMARTIYLSIQRIVDCIADLGPTPSQAANVWKAMWPREMAKSEIAATICRQRMA